MVERIDDDLLAVELGFLRGIEEVGKTAIVIEIIV